MPPTQSPLRFDAAILSRMRSEVTSRSNWANDSRTFNVSRPIEVVVLNCWVTDIDLAYAAALPGWDAFGRRCWIRDEFIEPTPSACNRGNQRRSRLGADGAHVLSRDRFRDEYLPTARQTSRPISRGQKLRFHQRR